MDPLYRVDRLSSAPRHVCGRRAAFFAAAILVALLLAVVFFGAIGFFADCGLLVLGFAISAVRDLWRLRFQRDSAGGLPACQKKNESGETQPATVFALFILAIVIIALIGAWTDAQGRLEARLPSQAGSLTSEAGEGTK